MNKELDQYLEEREKELETIRQQNQVNKPTSEELTNDTNYYIPVSTLTKFKLDINPENGMIILNNKEDGIIIDRAIHGRIAATLRFLHNIEKNRRKPGNEDAKQYLLERAKIKSKRKKKKKDSELESLIVSLVNTEQFKYDFDTVRNLTIYQFNKCVKQITHKIDYEHRMQGVYAGTIDSKKLSQDDLSWLSN